MAETWDGILNDLNGFHVRPEHVHEALDRAAGGRVAEGGVGGGTGMICNGFKGGIGTSSRVLERDAGGWTVGVLVQCNYGTRRGLRIAGVPVGQELTEPSVCLAGNQRPSLEFLRDLPPCGQPGASAVRPREEQGSIIVIVATDAPLLPHQLARLVKRVTEEAITNALVAAETMTGADDVRVLRLPHDRLREIHHTYHRLTPLPAP